MNISLATKMKVPWLPVSGKNGMSWDEHVQLEVCYFQLPLDPSGEDCFIGQKLISYLGCKAICR